MRKVEAHPFFNLLDTPRQFPLNTRHWINVASMLARRLRRRTNIDPTLIQCLVFAGKSTGCLVSVKATTCWPQRSEICEVCLKASAYELFVEWQACRQIGEQQQSYGQLQVTVVSQILARFWAIVGQHPTSLALSVRFIRDDTLTLYVPLGGYTAHCDRHPQPSRQISLNVIRCILKNPSGNYHAGVMFG